MSDSTPAAPPAPDAPANLSKRRLIDSITSLDSVFKDPVGGKAAKKRKTSSTPPTPRTSTPALEALLARSAPPAASTPSTTSPPASYDPTSLPSLLSRLQTYSRLSSFSPSKPASLSSLNCALHGWKHTPSTRERVECVTCGRAVVLLPPSTGSGGWTSEAGKKLREEYEKALFSREAHESLHKEACPWRMRPCARSLYRLPGGGLGVPAGAGGGGKRRLVEDVAKVAAEMEERGLGEMSVEVPKEAGKLVGGEEAKERLVQAVRGALPPPTSDDAEAPTQPPLSATTILLALFGWSLSPSPSSTSSSLSRPTTPTLSRSASSASSTSISSLPSLSSTSTPILSCAYCHRQVLASSYLPSSTSSSSAVSASTQTFDLAKQHHSFCPYVSSPSSSPPSASTSTPTATTKAAHAAPPSPALKPGWQVRLEAVLGSSSARRVAGQGGGEEGQGQGQEQGQGQQQREGMNEGARLVEQGKTQDLLRYVRTLLGPKPKAKVAPGLPATAAGLQLQRSRSGTS